jgi:WD40 repeat protein
MLKANGASADASLGSPAALELAVDRFEDAWQRGENPSIDEHLNRAGNNRTALLIELVHIDLEYRLKSGEAVRVETYLQRFPELGVDRNVVLELVMAECSLRRRREDGVQIAEYVRRFPAYREELLASATTSLAPPSAPEALSSPCGSTVALPSRASPSEPKGFEGPATEPAKELATWSRYRVLRLHARGGLGEILAARDEELGREVALKRLQRNQSRDPGSRDRFLREAELTSQLEHPGVVPVYGLGQAADGSPVYAMRFIRGETFQEAVERFHQADQPGRDPGERSLAFRQLLGRFVSVCNTVAYAHSRGVLHRDLKPSNILLGNYGETLVVDWGLAKPTAEAAVGYAPNPESLPPAAGSDLTQEGEIIGTPAYMSPEQATARWDAVGPASDIYSLGATLYVLLAGQPPFAPGPVCEVLDKVRRADYPRPRQVKKGVSQALEAVCLKAIAPRAEDRYGTALALAADLEQWLAGEPVSAWTEPLRVRLRRWVARNRTLVTAAAVALLAGGALAWVTTLWGAAADRARAASISEEKAHQQAELQRIKLEQADPELYFFHLNAANSEWWARHFPAAGKRLAKCKPELHGWEWNYLVRRQQDSECLHTLLGHEEEVWNAVFSPDGKSLVSTSLDGTVRVWDAATGEKRFLLQGHTGEVRGLAYSPDGNLLATGSCNRRGPDGKVVARDRSVRLWNAKTGELDQAFEDLRGDVLGVAFSPDGKLLAAALDASRDPSGNQIKGGGEIRLWDVARRIPLAPLPAPTGGLTSVAFSPDGKTLAAGAADRQVRRWDVATGTEGEPLNCPQSVVRNVAFSTDGQWLASASMDVGTSEGIVQVWEVSTGKIKHKINAHSWPAWGIAFSPDSRRLASSGDDATIRFWDVDLGRLLVTLYGHEAGIANVAFSPDGRQVVSASDDRTLKVWDATVCRTSLTLVGHKNRVWAVAFSPDGKWVASAGDDQPRDDEAVRVWDSATGRQHLALSLPGGAAAVAFSPDGQRLAAAGLDKTVRVWEVISGREEQILRGHGDKVLWVAFSPDGRLLASASADRTVKLWDLAAGNERFTLRGHANKVRSVAFSPDGQHLASGGEDKNVVVWEVGKGRQERTLPDHGGGVRRVAFSPDGKRLAAATTGARKVLTSESGEVKLWDLESGKAVQTMHGHPNAVSAVTFSPDGRRLVSAGEDPWIRLWEPVTGQEVLRLDSRHLDCVNDVAFSPDGTRLASASCDGTVVLWNGATPDAPPK